MAFGFPIFDFSSTCSAKFLRLCLCNRTRVVPHNLQERAAVGNLMGCGPTPLRA
jgi:hypothetical protein